MWVTFWRALEPLRKSTTQLTSLFISYLNLYCCCLWKKRKKTQMKKMLMMKKMKRKDLELDEFSDDFSDFSLSAPARKIRRLVLFSFFPTFIFFWVFFYSAKLTQFVFFCLLGCEGCWVATNNGGRRSSSWGFGIIA